MRWLVTLSARTSDVERLSSEPIEGLSANPDDPEQLLLKLDAPESDAAGEDAARAMRPELEAFMKRINGVGRLRWGRVFEGIEISNVVSVDDNGNHTQHIWVEGARAYVSPEDFAQMVEGLGHERPQLPKGIEVVKALDVPASIGLAAIEPAVMRAVHLVYLMLEGDDEIDWVAGYAALEIVEHDLQARELDGKELGWWTRRELTDFKATANSPDALGSSARHGKPSSLKEARMNTTDASLFVRRIVGCWVTYLLTMEASSTT